jgi:hypothetical protein
MTFFAWKQVTLEFFSLTLRLAEVRRRVVYAAPSQRLRWDQVEDGRVDTTGYVKSCYTYFTVFMYYIIWTY